LQQKIIRQHILFMLYSHILTYK